MLKNLRIGIALLIFVPTCLLFAGGLATAHLSFLAKIQLVPAILSGSVLAIILLLLLTLLCGRIYCSVICPLGVFQDIVSRLGKPRSFRYRQNHKKLRLVILVIFLAALFSGISLIFGLLEPYSAFGRMATTLLGALWQAGNNGLAWLAARSDQFWAAHNDIWLKGFAALAAGIVTFMVIGVLAFIGGRTWCNTICPVGAALGFLNRYALLRPRIVPHACVRCGKCAKTCKASCIDAQNAVIDASRCVSCFNCLKTCSRKAVTYTIPHFDSELKSNNTDPDSPRRALMVAAIGTAAALPLLKTDAWARESETEITALTPKEAYRREVAVLPPGAQNHRSFSKHCTACQLCVAACTNQVIHSRDYGLGVLLPVLSFERGYCRPNCVACTEVCPTGAIMLLTVAAKGGLQIGRAVVNLKNCLLPGGENCTACSRNCPATAINVVTTADGGRYPVVNHEICTGCGACEFFCPIRPQAAITVTGNHEQRWI